MTSARGLLTGFDLCRVAMAVEGITAPEQSVLLVLAVMANEDAQCWPGINGAGGLTGKTKLSERTVQRAVQGLKDAGHINWVDRPGRGRVYIVHPRHSDTPCEETPVTVTPRQSDTPVTVTPTPVTVTPKLPRTTNIPKKPRETPIPDGFEPEVKPGSITAKAMDDWPPGRREEEIEHFADHHAAKGTLSKDWQASWRTWVKNSKKWEPRNARPAPANHRNGTSPTGRGRSIDAGFAFISDGEPDRSDPRFSH